MLRRLLTLVCTVAALAVTLAAEAADPPPSPYAMVRLHSLACHKISDGLFGGDEEPILRVASLTVWATEGARPGKKYDLTRIEPVVFHEKCDIALTERDPGNEDTIGVREATLKELGAGKQTVQLEANGSSYTLVYEVVRAPGRCARLRLHDVSCVRGIAGKAEESDSISVSVGRFTAYSVLHVGAGKTGSTPAGKFDKYPDIAFSETAAVQLDILTTAAPPPRAKGKLDPNFPAPRYRNTTLPAQKVQASLAGKGRHRLTFRTTGGAHLEVIFEVLR